MSDTVAAVIVTYNRADLLELTLAGLAAQTVLPGVVVVVDNASTDHTAEVLARHPELPLDVVRSEENTGGAGGFHRGMRHAHGLGVDRIWLMDDDVVPAPDCLETLLGYDAPCLAGIREDRGGNLVEKAALTFDLRNPLRIRPKSATVDTTYATRGEMPTTVPLENVAFEGFLVKREVVDTVGFPDPTFFIFYDDVDFAVRARRAGFAVLGVRDAVMVRQLDFDQQHALDTWKGFYMFRNLFVVHFRYGENALVRAKPWLVMLAVLLLSPLRGGRREAANVTKAMRSARGMRGLPGVAKAGLPPSAR